MRTYIERLVTARSHDPRVRLPRSARPRRARTTFIAIDTRAALAH